jgi:hypothetical protein
VIPKSGNRFSEKDHAQNNNLERDDDSKKNHPALGDPLDPSAIVSSSLMRWQDAGSPPDH